MKSFFASLLALGSFLSVVSAQALVINTPSPLPVTCEPTQLTWGGGSPPYFINLVSGDDPSQIIINFGELSNVSLTWLVKEPAGTNLLLTIRDQTGAHQSSATFMVASGGPTDCLNAGSSSASGSTASGSKSASVSVSRSVSVSSTTATSTSTTAISIPPSITPSASVTAPVSNSNSNSRSASVSAPLSSAPPQSGAALPTGVPGAAAAAALGAVFAALL